ncbi:MAG: hypothetical protein R2910_12965 [Gemmatimonadales bacterium]
MPRTLLSPRFALLALGGLVLLGWARPRPGSDSVALEQVPSGTTVEQLQVKVVTGSGGLGADSKAGIEVVYHDPLKNIMRTLSRQLNVRPTKDRSGATIVVRNAPIALTPRSKQVLTIKVPLIQQPTATQPAVQLRLSDLRHVNLTASVVGPSMAGVVGPSMAGDGWDVMQIIVTWSGHGPKGEPAHGTLLSRSGEPLQRFMPQATTARWTSGTLPSFRPR